MIKTNVPKNAELYVDNAVFSIGNRIRIAMKNRSGYIGEITEIKHDTITLRLNFGSERENLELKISDIEKLRQAEPNETFDTVPYFDEEEREFWRTHWHTKDGIKEKTPEDIKMLEEFFAKYK